MAGWGFVCYSVDDLVMLQRVEQLLLCRIGIRRLIFAKLLAAGDGTKCELPLAWEHRPSIEKG